MALTYFVLLNAGGIFIANNKERLDEYKRLGTIAKPFGIETYVLSPEETKKLYPLMNVDDIYGTLYSPGDGTIDPNGLCQALTRSATRAGCNDICPEKPSQNMNLDFFLDPSYVGPCAFSYTFMCPSAELT